MKVYAVRLGPVARRQANALYEHIAAESDPAIADRFVRAVLEKCQTLATVPGRGSPRRDLGPGLRSIAFHRRTQIVYFVTNDDVEIAGIFYGGQDLAAAFDGR